MGFDVNGKDPKTKRGKYFHRNKWSWHPLADYMEHVAPDLTSKVKYMHSNDGGGLDGDDAVALADILQTKIDSGAAERYVRGYKMGLAALPLVECYICNGSGVRNDDIAKALGFLGATCTGCDGAGEREDFRTLSSISLHNIVLFATFARDSGGFEIW